MSDAPHILEASGHWTNDDSDTASVQCTHPRCTTYTSASGWNDEAWPGYDWDNFKPLVEILSEAQASHDAWLARTPQETE